MKKNIGQTDKLIRLLLAAVIAVLYISNVITGTAGLVLLIVAILLVATSLINFCGIYALLGINTCKKKK